MARRTYKPVDPAHQFYTYLLIQRLLQKQQAAQQAEQGAARQQVRADQERLTGTPESGWSAVPGARNTSVPFVMGEGGQHGYDELYAGSPYADQGRNWSSPEQWARYNDSSRIPDWLRTPDSGLGPAFEPSPELQILRGQVGDLRGLAAQNETLRSSLNLPEIARAVKMAEEDAKWNEAWDQVRGIKPVPPGIANVYGPYNDSQDRYGDVPPPRLAENWMEGAFPENPMPYDAGTDVVPGFIEDVRGATRNTGQRLVPDKTGKFVPSTTPGPQWGEASAENPPPLPEAPIKKMRRGQKEPPPVRLSGQPVGFSSRGDETIPDWALEEYGIKPPSKAVVDAGPWSTEVPPQALARTPLPEPGTLWDNYQPEFVAAMHSGDPNEIDKAGDLIKLYGW